MSAPGPGRGVRRRRARVSRRSRLARALAGRGHEVVVETWEHWREAVEGVGLGFAAARGVQDVSPAPARLRAAARRAADAALALLPMLEARALRRRRQRHPHARAGARRRARRAAAGDADPARLSGARGRGCRSSRSARCRRARRSAAALWRAALPVLLGGLKRGRDELNESRARRRPARRSSASTAGSPSSWRWSRRSRSSSTRAAGRPQVRVTGPMRVRAPLPGRRAAGGRRRRWSWWRRRPPRIPTCRLVRVALEALADEPVRVLATTNRHAPPEPLPPAPANARGRRLAELLAGDGGRRPGRLPRRPRDRRPGARRRACRCSAARRSATWPRTAPGSPGRAPG